MPYEELETQWAPMLHRFARWNIPGKDYDDLLQEMRIVLFKSQQTYDPKKGAKFITFLWRGCLNRIRKIRHQAIGTLKAIPQDKLVGLCDGDHAPTESPYCPWCKRLPITEDDVEVFELLEGAPREAQWLAGLVLYGESNRWEWKRRGMTDEQIESGTEALKQFMQRGDVK
jgi:DNA-directed RNA polymerase specialized sigma24 family protein